MNVIGFSRACRAEDGKGQIREFLHIHAKWEVKNIDKIFSRNRKRRAAKTALSEQIILSEVSEKRLRNPIFRRLFSEMGSFGLRNRLY